MPKPHSALRAAAGVLLIAPCVWLAACSTKPAELNPVQGKVLHKGEPLSGALVSFHPEDPNAERSTGLTNADGTFSLSTGQVNGAPSGKYVVTIICSEIPKDIKQGLSTGGIETQDRLQGAYANPSSSRLTAEVKDGPNQLAPFELN
jgi:hypothetical protein